MTTIGDVHVGDVGTLYKARIQDAGVDFDPTDATVAKLIFKTPSGVLERDATIVGEPDPTPTAWYLTYQTNAADDQDFHERKGTYKWQGYVEFAGGEEYHTNIETYVVAKNLN